MLMAMRQATMRARRARFRSCAGVYRTAGVAHHHDGERSALTEAAFGQAPHQHAARGCGHHFRRRASRVTSFSSSYSASNFFSRVFALELLQALGVRHARWSAAHAALPKASSAARRGGDPIRVAGGL